MIDSKTSRKIKHTPLLCIRHITRAKRKHLCHGVLLRKRVNRPPQGKLRFRMEVRVNFIYTGLHKI